MTVAVPEITSSSFWFTQRQSSTTIFFAGSLLRTVTLTSIVSPIEAFVTPDMKDIVAAWAALKDSVAAITPMNNAFLIEYIFFIIHYCS